MTALEQYVRLEAPGRWREQADRPWREVLVSFGNASLVLSDFDEAPLTHWALASLIAEQRAEGGVRYVPDASTEEVLEIDDAAMIEAIAEVTKSVRLRPSGPKRRNVTMPLFALLILGAVAAGAAYGPVALANQAFALIPPERAALVGESLSDGLKTCGYGPGRRALAQIAAKLDLDPDRIRVAEDLARPVTRLPGGHLLLSADLVAETTSASTLAGWLLTARSVGPDQTVLRELIDGKSPAATLGFLFSGKIEDADITWMRDALRSTAPPPPQPALAAALRGLAKRGIPADDFLSDLRRQYSGLTLARPEIADNAPPLLDDQSWVALQSICTA